MTATVEFADLPETSAASFAQEHFGTANLGHQKRNAALVRTANRIFRHPGGTLPQKMGDPTAYKSMDALMNRPEVTHASVLAAHQQRTREKMAAHAGPLLIVHDSSTLDYSGLKSIDLGPVGDGNGRGYLCHNSLVVDPQNREVLGLANQILHRREPVRPDETTAQKRAREGRESRLWSTAAKTLGTPAPGLQVIDVCDRGADIFEFFATEQGLGRTCLVRATHNRSIVIGHDENGPRSLLFTHMRTLPSRGTKTKTIFESNQEQQRSVKLSVAFAPVLLLPPHVRRGEYEKTPIKTWCVRVWEADPPKDGQPLEWFLLALEPVTSVSAAWTTATNYECRFVVEEYHKGQKTGCQVEDLQFTTEQALQPMIALLSVVAAVLLNLRQACRRPDADQRLATELVDPIYEEILRAHRYPQARGPLTIKEFYLAVARLGGHMNRRSDGMPGWLTLWRGWTKLQLLVTGAEADRRRRRKNAG